MLMKLKLVFFMPNEEIFKKDDLSRELALVNFGACCIYEDDKVARVVRHDVSIRLIRRFIAVYVKFTPVLVSPLLLRFQMSPLSWASLPSLLESRSQQLSERGRTEMCISWSYRGTTVTTFSRIIPNRW